MDSQTLNTFRYVVGAPRPILLAVRKEGGGSPDIHEVDSPFVILGRGRNSHVRLKSPEVSFRHACFVVIGGRILCLDLLSNTGIEWDGPHGPPWLSPEHRLKIGPYWIQLLDDGWVHTPDLTSPLDFKPRSQAPAEYGELPDVELELLTGPGRGGVFPLNRVLTLVGRDERCRITCADEGVSRVHCALLLAPSGLWVIDLLGRNGVRFDGEPVNCVHLAEGAEFEIGRYGFRVHYSRLATAAAAQSVAAQPPSTAKTDSLSDDARSALFLTRNHQVFPVTVVGETLVVSPQGDIREFFYQDIHLDSNQVTRLLQTLGFRSVLVDFKDVPLVGSVILDAVATFCRTASQGAVMCGASPEMHSVLETMKFPSIWPYYQSRDEALRALGEQTEPAPSSEAGRSSSP